MYNANAKLNRNIILCKNEAFGNYIAAGKVFKPGELILEEKALLSFPSLTGTPCQVNVRKGYDSMDAYSICLACGKHLTSDTVCRRCKWPLCNDTLCDTDPGHSGSECPIFATNGILPRKSEALLEFAAIQVLRGLTFYKGKDIDWKMADGFEANLENRRNCLQDRKTLTFIIDFIRVQCKCTEYEPEVIDRIMGILETNSYYTYPYLDRRMSVVFDKGCFCNHDCNPNTIYTIIEKPEILDGVRRMSLYLQLHARYQIECNDPLTITYVEDLLGYEQRSEREAYLWNIFFFKCSCKRCAEGQTEGWVYNK